jgi:hypothetical protein
VEGDEDNVPEFDRDELQVDKRVRASQLLAIEQDAILNKYMRLVQCQSINSRSN